MTVLLTGCRDLCHEGGIRQCYLTIKPFQCGVYNLQMAVTALQLQAMHVTHSGSIICSMAGSSFLTLKDIFFCPEKKRMSNVPSHN